MMTKFGGGFDYFSLVTMSSPHPGGHEPVAVTERLGWWRKTDPATRPEDNEEGFGKERC